MAFILFYNYILVYMFLNIYVYLPPIDYNLHEGKDYSFFSSLDFHPVPNTST